jgi:hypothetical protein
VVVSTMTSVLMAIIAILLIENIKGFKVKQS